MAPGNCAVDAPVLGSHGEWLLGHLQSGSFTLMVFAKLPRDAIAGLENDGVACTVIQVTDELDSGPSISDREGLLAQRYDAHPGTCYLFRPDQHVCARWRSFDLARVRAAIARAGGAAGAALRKEAA